MIHTKNLSDDEYNTIKEWKKENKLKKPDAKLLIEAYRRFHAFHKGETLSEAWTGLGMREYDYSIFFEPVFNRSRPKRCAAWFRLTQSGRSLVSRLNARLPWRPGLNRCLYEGI